MSNRSREAQLPKNDYAVVRLSGAVNVYQRLIKGFAIMYWESRAPPYGILVMPIEPALCNYLATEKECLALVWAEKQSNHTFLQANSMPTLTTMRYIGCNLLLIHQVDSCDVASHYQISRKQSSTRMAVQKRLETFFPEGRARGTPQFVPIRSLLTSPNQHKKKMPPKILYYRRAHRGLWMCE